MAEGAAGSIWASVVLDIAPYIKSEQTVVQRIAKLDQTMQAETTKMAEHWRTLGDAVKRSMTEPLQAEQQVWQARITMAQQGTAQQKALMEQHIQWLRQKVADTNLPIAIRADFKRDLQQAERDLAAFETTSKQRADAIASHWQRLGTVLSVSVTAPLVLLGRQMVTTFAQFEQSLANAGAVAQATTEEMRQMEHAARQAGATTVFSAGEAADAMYYLASGGMAVTEQIDAMTGVLDLAAATQSGLADSAAVTSAVLAAFGLQAEESGRVANVFSAAINNSMASLEKLSGGMRQVGPIAGAFNMQLEEVTAALGLLYNAGYEGAQAGTILRSALSSLTNPTGQTKDVITALNLSLDSLNPGMHSLAEIMDTLRASGISVAQAMAMFGDQAGPGMVQLLNQGSSALLELQEKITGTNTAADTAARQVDTLVGSVKLFRSVLEEAYISLTQSMEPALRGLVAAVTAALEVFNRLDPSFRRFIVTAGAVAAAAGPLALAIVGLRAAIGSLVGPAGLIVAVVAALAGLGAALSGSKRDHEEYNRKALETARANREQADRLRALIREYDALSGKPNKSKEEHGRLKTVMEDIIKIQPSIAKGYDDIGEAIDRIGEAIDRNRQKLSDYADMLKEQSEAEIKIAALRAEAEMARLRGERNRLESEVAALETKVDDRYEDDARVIRLAARARIHYEEIEAAKRSGRDISEASANLRAVLSEWDDAITWLPDSVNYQTLQAAAKGLEAGQASLGKQIQNRREQLAETRRLLEEQQSVLDLWRDISQYGPPRPPGRTPEEPKAPLAPGDAETVTDSTRINEALQAALEKYRDLLSVNSELVNTADRQIAYLEQNILQEEGLIKLQRERAEVQQMIFGIAIENAERLAERNEWNAQRQLEHLDEYLAQYAISYDQIEELEDRRTSLRATIQTEEAAAADARFAAAKRMYDAELEQLESIAYAEGRVLQAAEKRSLYLRIMNQHGRTEGQFTAEAIRANAAMELQFIALLRKEHRDKTDEEARLAQKAADEEARLKDEEYRRAMDLYHAETVGLGLNLREQQRIFNAVLNERLPLERRSAEARQAIALQNLTFMRDIAAQELALQERANAERIQMAIDHERDVGSKHNAARMESEQQLAEDLKDAEHNHDLITQAHERHRRRLSQIDRQVAEDRSAFHKQMLGEFESIGVQPLLESQLMALSSERMEAIRQAKLLGIDLENVETLYRGKQQHLREQYAEREANDRIKLARKTQEALDIEEGRSLQRRLTAFEATLASLQKGTDARKEFALTVADLTKQVADQETEALARSLEMAIEASTIRAELADDLDAEQKAAIKGLDQWVASEKRQLEERFRGTTALQALLLNAEELYLAKKEELNKEYETRRQDTAYDSAKREYQARIRALQTERATMDIPAAEKRAILEGALAIHTPKDGWSTETARAIQESLVQLDVQAAIEMQEQMLAKVMAEYEAGVRRAQKREGTTEIAPTLRRLLFIGAAEAHAPQELRSERLQQQIDEMRHDLDMAVVMWQDANVVRHRATTDAIAVLELQLAQKGFEADRKAAFAEYYAGLEALKGEWMDRPAEETKLDLELSLALVDIDRRELQAAQEALRDLAREGIEAFGPLEERSIEGARRFVDELKQQYSQAMPVLKNHTRGQAEAQTRLYEEMGAETKLALEEVASFEQHINAEAKRRDEDYQQWKQATGQTTLEAAKQLAWEEAKVKLAAAEAAGVGTEEARRELERAEFDFNRTMIDTLRDYHEYRNTIDGASYELRLERVRSLIEMEGALLDSQAENVASYRQLKLEEQELLQDIQAVKTENHLADMVRDDETLASLEEQIGLLEAYRDVIEDLGPEGAKALELVILALDATDAKLKQAKRSAEELRKEFDAAMAPEMTEAEQMKAWIIAKAAAYRDAGIALAEIGEWMDMQWKQFLDRQRQGTRDFWADWRMNAIQAMLGPLGGLFDTARKAWHTTYDVDEETGERYSKLAKAWEPFLETPLIEALIEGGQKAGEELLWAISTGWEMVNEAVPRWIGQMPRFFGEMFESELTALRRYMDESGVLGGLWRGFADILRAIPRALSDTWQGLQDVTGLDLSGTLFPWLRQFMADNLGSLFSYIQQTFSAAFGSEIDALRRYIGESGIIGGLWRGTLDAMRGLADGLTGMGRDAIRFLRLDYDEGIFSEQRQYLASIASSLIERMAGVFGGAFESEITALAGYISESGILGGLWRASGDVVRGLVRGIQGLWREFEDATGIHLSSLVRFLDFLLENWWSLFRRVFDALTDTFGPPLAALRQYMRESGALGGLWRGLEDVIRGLGVGLREMWRDVEEFTGIDLSGMVRKAVEWLGGIGTKIGEGIGGLFKKVAPQLWESAKNAGSALIKSLGALAGPLGEIFVELLQAAEPLKPVWDLLGKMLQMLANVIGHLLLPVFKALWPIIRNFGVVLMTVAAIVGDIWNSIVGFFENALRWLSERTILGYRPFAELGKTADWLAGIKMDTGSMYKERDDLLKLELDGKGDKDGKDDSRGSAGLQVTRMTGETRDVFIELLRPLNALSIMPGLFDNVLQRLDAILVTMRGMARGLNFEVSEAVITILSADIVVQSAGTVALQGPVTLNLPKQDLNAQATAAMRAGGV